MKQVLLKSLVLLSILISSCGSDDSIPLGEYENGIFVINEGNFQDGDGSVTYYGRSNSTIEQTIFSGVNDTQLGDVVQSGIVHEGLAYLVVNNSNKVEVVNAYTFEREMTIPDVLLPRYMAVSGDKGYLTEWVSFSDPGRVSIIDLASGTVDNTITVGFGAEDVEVVGNKIFVSNSFGNTISVIDQSNNNSVETVTVSSSPKGMVIDKNGDLWVACGGGFDANFSPANNGAIYKIDPSSNEILTTYELNANFSAKMVMNNDRDALYYYVGNTIFVQNVEGTSISTEPFAVVEGATSIYGIGLDPTTGIVYVGDSKFFAEDGEVFRYDPNGTLIDSFDTGVAPNSFIFN